jgi:hypothetical protein
MSFDGFDKTHKALNTIRQGIVPDLQFNNNTYDYIYY